MRGDPDRLREWAAHWASKGHGPDSGLLLAQEIWDVGGGQTERWDVGGGQTERWELRLADLNATLAQLDAAEPGEPPSIDDYLRLEIGGLRALQLEDDLTGFGEGRLGALLEVAQRLGIDLDPRADRDPVEVQVEPLFGTDPDTST